MDPVFRDPRYQEAVRLFGMWDWGWGMPSDPHARENLRHAAGRLACGDEGAPRFLELVLSQYLGAKYRDAARSDIERIARSASRAGTATGKGEG